MKIFSPAKQLFGHLIVCSILFMQGLLLFWAFYPYTPIVIDYINPIEIINGEKFVYEMKYEKKMPIPATITKQFIDGLTWTLSGWRSNVDIGESLDLHEIKIPKLPPGDYVFRWSGTYKVNPIRDVTVVAETKCFKIK